MGRVSYLRDIRRKLGTVGRVAEIGVLRGRFAASLLAELRPRELILVDPWRQMDHTYSSSASAWDFRHDYVQKRFEGDKRVRILRATSLEAAPLIMDGSLDLVYIDADHREESVLADLIAWAPKVRDGGFIAGHDFTPDDPRTREVVSAVRRFFGPDFERIVSPLEREGTGARHMPRSYFLRVE